jgi:hypothetical protein
MLLSSDFFYLGIKLDRVMPQILLERGAKRRDIRTKPARCVSPGILLHILLDKGTRSVFLTEIIRLIIQGIC